MLVCPLFDKFREPTKTVKLGCEYQLWAKIGRGYWSTGTVWFEFAKIKDALIILHAKSPTFKAAKLKSFTVFNRFEFGHHVNWHSVVV